MAPDRMPLGEITAAFEAQLADQGWEVHPVDATENHASISAERLDDDGQRWSTFLAITRVPANASVSLDLWTVGEKAAEGEFRWEVW